MFNLDSYKSYLHTQWLGHDLLYFEKLESTNSYLKNISGKELNHGKVCLTDYQTRGRGQYERNWESLPAQNLTFSLAFTPRHAERLHVLTLTCARAAVELVAQETDQQAFIKWPNDIFLNNRKIGGLLTETVFSGNRLDRVVVGIGFNVNQENFENGLKETATSLKLETQTSFQREQLLADYLGLAEYGYKLWHKNDKGLLKSINQKIIGYGNWITLSVNGNERSGKYKLLGVNEDGRLTVINKESELELFSYEQIRLITD